MGYVKKTEISGMRHRYYYVETPNKIDNKKGRIRSEIVKKVSDRDDLIADLFKLSFLTISALKEVYKVINKDNIPDEMKKLLNDSFEKYEKTKTIMDLLLEKGDYGFIDRLLERQENITKILEDQR